MQNMLVLSEIDKNNIRRKNREWWVKKVSPVRICTQWLRTPQTTLLACHCSQNTHSPHTYTRGCCETSSHWLHPRSASLSVYTKVLPSMPTVYTRCTYKTESGWQPKTINVPCLQSAMIKPPVLLGQGLQLVRQSSHLNTREITPFNQGEKIVTVSFIKLTEQMVAYNFLLLKIFYKKNKLHTCFTLIPSGFKHIFLLTTLKQN